MVICQFELDVADRDAVLLSLAICSLDRPEHLAMLRDIALRIGRGGLGGEIFEECRRVNADRYAARPPLPLGPLGTQSSRGPLNADDEGQLQMGVRVEHGTVVLHFGTPIAWIGLPPAQARDVGRVLIERADQAAKVQ